MDFKLTLQIITLVQTVLCLATLGALWRLRPAYRGLLLLPFSYLVHVLIFYISVFFIPVGFKYSDWSAVLRWQGISLLLGAALIYYMSEKGRTI